MIVPNARKDDNFHSIGRNTGYFLGVGFAPLLVNLPHTQLPYRIAPSIETTGVKKPADLMHDRVEYEVPFDVRDLINMNYLLRYDPFIRAAMRF